MARRDFREAIRIRPREWSSQFGMGRTYWNEIEQNAAKARPYFEEAIRLKPDSAEAHFDLGGLLQKTGKTKEASRRSTRKAIAIRAGLSPMRTTTWPPHGAGAERRSVRWKAISAPKFAVRRAQPRRPIPQFGLAMAYREGRRTRPGEGRLCGDSSRAASARAAISRGARRAEMTSEPDAPARARTSSCWIAKTERRPRPCLRVGLGRRSFRGEGADHSFFGIISMMRSKFSRETSPRRVTFVPAWATRSVFATSSTNWAFSSSWFCACWPIVPRSGKLSRSSASSTSWRRPPRS